MTRIEEIKAACKSLEYCEFQGKGFEAESILLNNGDWLLEMVERMVELIQAGIDLPPSQHDYDWRFEAKAFLAELEGK